MADDTHSPGAMIGINWAGDHHDISLQAARFKPGGIVRGSPLAALLAPEPHDAQPSP